MKHFVENKTKSEKRQVYLHQSEGAVEVPTPEAVRAEDKRMLEVIPKGAGSLAVHRLADSPVAEVGPLRLCSVTATSGFI